MTDRIVEGPHDPAQRLVGAALSTPPSKAPPPRPYRPPDLTAVPPPPLTLERLRRTQRRMQVVTALALLLATVATARPWFDDGVLRGERLELNEEGDRATVTLDGLRGLVMERDGVETVRLWEGIGGELTLRHRDPEGVITASTLAARWGLTLERPEGRPRAWLRTEPAGQLALFHPDGFYMLEIVAKNPLHIYRRDRLSWEVPELDPLSP